MENNKIYEIQVNRYSNGKLDATHILKGTLHKIFDDFTALNDHLRYINNCRWEFDDKNVEREYNEFLDNYKGNFFLDNAVRRGCIID